MTTVTLIEANVSHHCPVSNLYGVGEPTNGQHDRYLLVTVKSAAAMDALLREMTSDLPLIASHLAAGVDVSYTDARAAQFFDANDDPTDGVNPIASTDPDSIALKQIPDDVTTHEGALRWLGYSITEEP